QRCDSAVLGYGEPVWPAVLADAENGALRKQYGPNSHRRETVWSTPRLNLLPVLPGRFTLQTERGCPLACDFCAASRLLGPFEEKPPARIADELAQICRIMPNPIIELADDNTFAGT